MSAPSRFDFDTLPATERFPERRIRVHLPASYRASTGTRFPLIVFQDGQNVFDRGRPAVRPAWGADRVMAHLVRSKLSRAWVAVGIDHRESLRIGDYAPYPDPRHCDDARGARYVDDLCERILPWLRARYRLDTDPASNAIAGSSLGGLVALFAGSTRPDTFGRVAALSPSVMWADYRILDQLRSQPCRRLYVDAGAGERVGTNVGELDYGSALDRLERVVSATMRPESLRVVLDRDGNHDEWSWRRRLPAALAWLLSA